MDGNDSLKAMAIHTPVLLLFAADQNRLGPFLAPEVDEQGNKSKYGNR